MPKKILKRLATTALERNTRMMATAVFSSSRYALGVLAQKVGLSSGNKEQLLTQEIQTIVSQLAALKGSAQKLGQFLSIVGESFFSPEIMVILRTLQSDTPPLSWERIHKTLKKQFSAEVLAELEISEVALATASIGQVHRAVIKATGEQLVLKVQYPGVDRTIDSDIKTLRSLLGGISLIPGLPEMDGIFEEARQMMRREVDYVRERDTMEEFRDILKDDRRFVIPKTFPRYCSKRVLASAYVEGLEIASPEVAAFSEDVRSRLAESFLELYFKEFFELGYVQTDPHFGNYRVRIDADGRPQFVLFDFGAMRRFPKKFVKRYADMVAATLENDAGSFMAAWKDIGLESTSADFSEHLWTASAMIVEPFGLPSTTKRPDDFDSLGRYHWGRSNLGKEVSQFVYDKKFSFNIKEVPHELLFLDRKLAGVYVMLAKLNAPTRTREILLKCLEVARR